MMSPRAGVVMSGYGAKPAPDPTYAVGCAARTIGHEPVRAAHPTAAAASLRQAVRY